MGIIKEDNTIVLPFKYDRIKIFDQFVDVKKGNKQRFIPYFI